jgi:MarR family 2-MHQ and catechol resistance regulon transcriptional repressor
MSPRSLSLPSLFSPAPETAGDSADAASPDEARALKLWVVLARASAAVSRHAEDDIERHGLGFTEFAALEALYHKGPLLLSDIQRRILVSSGGITYVIDRLEKKGLVERQACPSDRRATYAALTPRGRALVAEIFPAHRRRIAAALAGLSADEQEQALHLLRRLGKYAASLAGSSPELETE